MKTQRSAMFLLGKSALTGALGGLLFGFDTAVIAGTTGQLTAQFGLTPSQLGLTVSIGLWGTVIGALGSGVLGQRLGSRGALRILGVLYVVSALGCAFAPTWAALLAFRFIGGLGIGGSSVLGPVYIAELSPAQYRGRLVGLFQMNVVIGILVAYLSNAVVAHFVHGFTMWRWDFGIAALPAVLFLAMLLSVPQSSRWLVSQNRIDEAMDILSRMGSPDSRAEVDAILLSLREEGGLRDTRLFQRRYSLPIFLAVSIGFFNQLAGINAILYYSNSIFASAGFSNVSADLQSIAIGAANLLATILGISLIDKAGRKTLLLVGAVGCSICLATAAVLFGLNQHLALLLPVLILFIIFFSVSQGAVIWVYISEVFPTNVRAKGQSLGSSSHWVMNALIAYYFPIISTHSKALPFAAFAGFTVLQFLVVLFVYPETKGYTLEDMHHHLAH